jgi:soluble lytic murein transglycosylase-like protein
MKSAAIAAAAATTALLLPALAHAQHKVGREHYRDMVARHAAENNLPEALVHRVIMRESKYHPHLTGKGGALGMMQIKLATARGVGYTGTAQGLYDPETNVKYATRYLAGAYRTAHGNHDLAVRYYAGGYYYAAKRQGMLPGGKARRAMARAEASALPPPLSLLPE